MTIVTTTINEPTEALVGYLEIAKDKGYKMVIVGDKKTPHKMYQRAEKEYECLTYLTPEDQEEMDQELSDLIGWNCIQRRNFGFIWALQNTDSEWIATIDDDNIPYKKWGDTMVRPHYTLDSKDQVIDPMSQTDKSEAWHRGFPIQLVNNRDYIEVENELKLPKVIAGLWDGAPDIDAIYRISNLEIDYGEIYSFPKYVGVHSRFNATKLMPFNSQNTILHRDCFPTYFLFPHLGRMDDIWAAYLLQHEMGAGIVTFTEATVYQDRNEHDLVKDMEQEMIGYKHSIDAVQSKQKLMSLLPEKSVEAYDRYKKLLM